MAKIINDSAGGEIFSVQSGIDSPDQHPASVARPAVHSVKRRLSWGWVLLGMLGALLCARSLQGHGGRHGTQPDALIDPLVTHHAVLEDEFKLNYARDRRNTQKATEQSLSLEVAYAFTDRWGAEVFAPLIYANRLDRSLLSDIGGLSAGDSEKRFLLGLGDVELQLPKFSFYSRYGLVLTGLLETRLPTGLPSFQSTETGLAFAPHLLVDAAFGRIGLQGNVAFEFAGAERAFEGSMSLAYAFPHGDLLLAPLIEFGVEAPLREATEGFVAVGIKVSSGAWHYGFGLQVFSGRSWSDRSVVLFQGGYHVSWNPSARGSAEGGKPSRGFQAAPVRDWIAGK